MKNLTVKDLKDAVLEYVKTDATWDQMSEGAKNGLIFLVPAATLGIFGKVAMKADTDKITILELVESLVELRESLITKKKN